VLNFLYDFANPHIINMHFDSNLYVFYLDLHIQNIKGNCFASVLFISSIDRNPVPPVHPGLLFLIPGQDLLLGP
jgi:hypothetical protein